MRCLVLVLLLVPLPAHAQDLEIYDQVVLAGEALAHGTEQERIAAANQLAELRAVYSVALLAPGLVDPSKDVRIAVVQALGCIKHPDAVEVLQTALPDAWPSVAAAAAHALGAMHMQEAYDALLAALGPVNDPIVKKAVHDGLRAWNEPHTPLPDPRTLPEGKAPPLPGKPEPGEKTIDKTNPYGKATPGPPPPELKKDIDITNPYGGAPETQGGPSLSASLKAGSAIDKDNPYDDVVTYEGEEDTWGEAPAPDEPMEEPEPPTLTPPPVTLGLWDMTPASFVSFEVATASVDDGAGRAAFMQIRGGYSGDHMGTGLVIPFAGGASTDTSKGEEWVFGNLGVWVRYRGAKDLGRLTLGYSGAFTMHLPSGDNVTWSEFGKDPDYFPSMSALYLNYYHQGLMYPDLEDSFKVALRPDLDLSLAIGLLSFQLELGFDFIVLGKPRDRAVPTWTRKLPDLVMFHLGFSARVQPTPWLQLFVELESTIEVTGRSAETFLFDAAFAGERAGSEALVTPGLSILLPLSPGNIAHMTLGLRVPLGEIGSMAGPMQLGPILVLQTGFRWVR